MNQPFSLSGILPLPTPISGAATLSTRTVAHSTVLTSTFSGSTVLTVVAPPPSLLDFDLSAAGQVGVVKGSDADWTVQSHTAAGLHPAFAADDTVVGRVYRGQDQSLLFTAAAVWATPSGYASGLAVISPMAAQSGLLEANGTYSLQVWWTRADGERTACIARRQLLVLPAPAASTQAITPYCTYQDMLEVAGWVALAQSSDTDQEGFYSQRLQARTWFDWCILNNYTGASVGTLEMHSTLAFNFGGGYGRRKSVGPSPSMIDSLAQNKLILRPQIVKACAHWSVSIVGLGQIGLNNQWAAYGAYHRDMAQREAMSITAEIDLTDTGIGSIFVPLSSTNTIRT